jgi:hypothetical protein
LKNKNNNARQNAPHVNSSYTRSPIEEGQKLAGQGGETVEGAYFEAISNKRIEPSQDGKDAKDEAKQTPKEYTSVTPVQNGLV